MGRHVADILFNCCGGNMITAEQVTEYFASLGITLPSFMIDCIVETVNSVERCMIDNGYTECNITLSLLNAAALIGISEGARKVTNNSVDVVSESYSYGTIEEIQNSITNNLRVRDPHGCTNSILPTKVNPSFLFTVTPCKKC